MTPQRSLFERIHVFYLPDDPLAELAHLIGWPVPIETDSTEVWDGGGAGA